MFALKGMPQDSQSDDDDDDDEQGGEEEDDIEDLLYAAAAAEKDKRKKKAKGKGKKGKGKEDESDEDSESESEEEEGWGAKKSAYYASNAEQIESDDEEANELEEQEARRLQAKARDTMVEDDFGLGDVVEGLPEDDGYVLCSTAPVLSLILLKICGRTRTVRRSAIASGQAVFVTTSRKDEPRSPGPGERLGRCRLYSREVEE